MLKELSLKYWNTLVVKVPYLNHKYVVSILIILLAIVGAKLLLIIF